MAISFSKAEAYLAEIMAKNTQAEDALRNIKTAVTNTKAILAAMAMLYAPVIADIDSGLVANPDDKAWQVTKAKANLLVADFVELKAQAIAMEMALVTF